jgi:two-component system, LytTR family, sensor histidine kinase AlgZ
LAELFQLALSSPKAEVSLRQEVDLARRYIGIEQLRFEQRLQVNWRVDEDVFLAATPILLLQPLLENAVRHGIEPSCHDGWVDVRVFLQGGRVHVMVANAMPLEKRTERAMPTVSGHGLALRNLQQRLTLLHDVEMQFEAGMHAANAQYPQPHFVVACAWPYRQVNT